VVKRDTGPVIVLNQSKRDQEARWSATSVVKKVIEQMIARVLIPAMEALENLGAQTQDPQEAGAIQVIKMIHGEE